VDKAVSVIRAETLFTDFVFEHNLPLACTDHAGSLFRKMFTDSGIAGLSTALAVLRPAILPIPWPMMIAHVWLRLSGRSCFHLRLMVAMILDRFNYIQFA